jgi:hypothetical protein
MNAACTMVPGTSVSPKRRSGAAQPSWTTVTENPESTAARTVASTHMLLIIPRWSMLGPVGTVRFGPRLLVGPAERVEVVEAASQLAPRHLCRVAGEGQQVVAKLRFGSRRIGATDRRADRQPHEGRGSLEQERQLAHTHANAVVDDANEPAASMRGTRRRLKASEASAAAVHATAAAGRLPVMRLPLVIVLTLTAACALAAPSAAVPPTTQTIVQHNVVEDQGQACGFPVRWTIDLTVERTRFFDQDGTLVRIIDHVREDNTVENLATGFVLREGPDAFQQVITFEGGTAQVAINGLALNLQGEQLKDVGRVILENAVIVFSAGPHPAREVLDGGRPISEALAVFCEALS